MLTPYLRNRALAERAEFVRLPNDEISDEIPRFAFRVTKRVANPWFIGLLLNKDMLQRVSVI